MKHTLVLAIETSCDDTSVSLVDEKGYVHDLGSANQDLLHQPFGGVVPEIASRSHTETLLPLIDHVLQRSKTPWSQIDGVAVTSEPGLLGSLLVGVVTAKALCLAHQKPLIGVNHIEGHLFAPLLIDASSDLANAPGPEFFPYLALAVSGGHTSIFLVKDFGDAVELGQTRDDAAGEAFDKFAKRLGLEYPGGPAVEKKAVGGDRARFQFPRALLEEKSLDFSFSGLKTAAQKLVEGLSAEDLQKGLPDLCASFQEAIVETLLTKLKRAQTQTGVRSIAITGGVSANKRLREVVQMWCAHQGYALRIPPIKYCTDNAAMIGLVGVKKLLKHEVSDLHLSPSSSTTARSGLRQRAKES